MVWMRNTRLPVVATVYLAALATVTFACGYAGLAVGRTSNQFWELQGTAAGDLMLLRNMPGGRAPEGYDLQFHPLGPAKRLGPPAGLILVKIAEPPLRLLHLPWQVGWPGLYGSNEYFIEAEEVSGSDRLWFWLPDEGVFEAYDARTHRALGRLGADGFRATGRVQAFRTRPGAGLSLFWRVRQTTWLVLPEQGRVSLVHLADQSVRTVMTVAGDEPPGVAITPTYLYPDTGALPDQMVIFVRTGGVLECHDYGGRRLTAVPLTDGERVAQHLEVGRTQDGIVVLAAGASNLEVEADATSVRRVAPSGVTLDSVVLAVPQGLRMPLFPGQIANRLTACAAPVWLAAEPVFTSWGGWITTTWSLVVGIIVGLGSALAIVVSAQRSRLSAARTASWGAFALVGGLPAVAAYFAAGDLPRMERCPACGARRPVHKAECPACGAPVPPPQATGTEIFE